MHLRSVNTEIFLTRFRFGYRVAGRVVNLPDKIHDRRIQNGCRVEQELFLAKGIPIGTFLDQEPDTLKAFELPPVYTIGPLTRPSSNMDNKPKFMK